MSPSRKSYIIILIAEIPPRELIKKIFFLNFKTNELTSIKYKCRGTCRFKTYLEKNFFLLVLKSFFFPFLGIKEQGKNYKE